MFYNFTPASNFVKGVDNAFLIIFGISFFFLIGLTALMLYFVFKYNRKRNPEATQIPDSGWLEFTWTVIPLLLVLLMFYYGYAAFLPMRNVPADAMPVKVIAKMWSWQFEYEKGKRSKELVVPLNKPVRLNLYSPDVIHGFFVPEFRLKEDVVPGKNNYTWFIPEKLGDYEIFCSAYCGLQHSYMQSVIRVLPVEDYKKWYASLTEEAITTGIPGLTIIQNNACNACHSIDGSKIIGPTFKGLYGSKRTVITDGKEHVITADDNYIRESILNPNKDIVKGFNSGLMKSYKDILKKEDIDQVIEYLKVLNEK